jgi:dTMP kinase
MQNPGKEPPHFCAVVHKSSPLMLKPLFITIEGIDGSGKTTQGLMLADHLSRVKGRHSLFTGEPWLGHPISRSIDHQEQATNIPDLTKLLLFGADRSIHVETVIKPALADGTVVVCDRFSDSTVAYQHYGQGLSMMDVQMVNSVSSQGLTPDLTIWLDIHPALAIQRTAKRGDPTPAEQDLAFLNRVRNGYSALCRNYPRRIVRIDGDFPVETLHGVICDRVLAIYRQFAGCRP